MEVDSEEDDLIVRSSGPPPDITYVQNRNIFSKNYKSSENQPLLMNQSSPSASPTRQISTISQTDLITDEPNGFIHLSCNHFPNDSDFSEIIKDVEIAIDHNILPERIYQGSSGSYFVKNTNLVIFLVILLNFKTGPYFSDDSLGIN